MFHPQHAFPHRRQNLDIKRFRMDIARKLIPDEANHRIDHLIGLVPFDEQKIPAPLIRIDPIPIVDPMGV